MKKSDESEALREVWEWKEKAYQDVKDLDLMNAVKTRLEDAIRTAELIQAKKKGRAA